MNPGLPGLTTLLGLLLANGAFAQADQILPPMGGPGGGQFFQRCRDGDILSGVDLRVGDDVDGIRPYCLAARAPTGGERHLYPKGVGSYGGEMARLACPDGTPAVNGLRVGYEGESTIIINNVHLFCSLALPNQPLTTYPTAVFDGPAIGEVGNGILVGGRRIPLTNGFAACPPGLVAVGITGRAGRWLDALSLICGALPYDPAPKPPAPPKPEPVKSIGRVNRGTTTPPPARPICDSARDSLSRQSPAAPNLVAQCRAAGGNASAGPGNADLEAARLRGEYLAGNDASAAALRDRMAGYARRGFEIGLGIWDQNTAPGPGKQRFHDALTGVEQQGFDVAAAYALPHNKYAALIGVGAVIANADPEVAAARGAEADPFFFLGFDIAGGLFGDPAAGSEGSKVVGAGALAIRNALNDPGRRGFDASSRLHLARHYE